MPLTGRTSFLEGPTLVSSKVREKLPYSPHSVASDAAAAATVVCVAPSTVVTMVLNPAGVNFSKDGRADKGVCRIVLVVESGTSGSVPLAVGYDPVQ